jgi:hypothetical protein
MQRRTIFIQSMLLQEQTIQSKDSIKLFTWYKIIVAKLVKIVAIIFGVIDKSNPNSCVQFATF